MMTYNTLYTMPAKKLAILATFTWGDSHVAQYNSTSEDITLGEVTYHACNEMAVTAAKSLGGPADAPWTISMFANRPPFLTLCRPFAHAPITCLITECDPSDETSIYPRWKGVVVGTLKNANQKAGIVSATISGWRSLLQFPLGIETTTQCAWTFGDSNCCIDLPSIRQTGHITAITGNTITVTGLVYPRDNYWRYGSAMVDGLAMKIVDYDGGAGIFKLIPKLPPPEWLDVDAVFTPGCDHLVDGSNGCRKWSNEQRFCGLGVKMLDYNPQFENK